MTFSKWLDTFAAEKCLEMQQVLEVEGPSGPNFIPVGCIIEAMKSAPVSEQNAIKDMIIRIDFRNGDVLHYFRHLAQALAI